MKFWARPEVWGSLFQGGSGEGEFGGDFRGFSPSPHSRTFPEPILEAFLGWGHPQNPLNPPHF